MLENKQNPRQKETNLPIFGSILETDEAGCYFGLRLNN